MLKLSRSGDDASRRQRPRPRRYHRAAVERAMTAGRWYLCGAAPTQAEAAYVCRSNPAYVSAAVAVLRTEDPLLIHGVLWGDPPLLVAARRAEQVGAFRHQASRRLAVAI